MLHGLAERVVAVESLVFLAKQLEFLHSYLEHLQGGSSFLQQFFSQVVNVCLFQRLMLIKNMWWSILLNIRILCRLSVVKEETKYVVHTLRLWHIHLLWEGSQRKAVKRKEGITTLSSLLAIVAFPYNPLVCGNSLKACDVSEVFHMVVATNKYVWTEYLGNWRYVKLSIQEGELQQPKGDFEAVSPWNCFPLCQYISIWSLINNIMS